MISLRDIKKTYTPGGEIVRALDGVSLTIGTGEFVAIMGTSGSGKSTMMQILGLLDQPTSGEYWLFGKNVASLDEATLAELRSRHFGFVFQQFFLLPKMTALENAALPLLYAGNTGDNSKALKSLERVGLASRVDHRPNEMSGGQQQRVAIARALVNDPEIIFADEPTGNLDSHTKVEIMEQLKALNAAGKTVILVTHEDEMAKYAKRIITMRDGKILTDTLPGGSLASPAGDSSKQVPPDNRLFNPNGVAQDSPGLRCSLPGANSGSQVEGLGENQISSSSLVEGQKKSSDVVSSSNIRPLNPSGVTSQNSSRLRCSLPGARVEGGPAPKVKSIHFFDYLKQAFASIWSHKTRSFLSVLGILIGVAAVIAMLSLGEGANSAMQKQLASLGSNMIMVRPGTPKTGGVALQSGSATRLTEADVAAIRSQVPNLNGVSGDVSSRVQVMANGKNANTQVDAVEPSYEKIRSLTPIAGRFFTEEEAQAGTKVALLGVTVIKEIFGTASPVGQTIRINATYFTVIGVLPARGVSGPRDQDDIIIIPLRTGMKRLLGKDYLDGIYIDVTTPQAVDGVQDSVVSLLSRRHRSTDDSAFEVRNMSDLKATLSSMTKTMSGLLGAVAAISLVVGGIGIMNIMLVAVVERTKEIGLRKAIGATKRDILFQFLFEAVLLSVIGGLLGVALGAGVSMLMALVLGWAIVVSMFAVVLSTTFSFLIGIVFGLWPAMKASDLSPIVALRYE